MNKQNLKVIETGDLRKNLSEILVEVKHDDVRYVIRRHKRVQASVIPEDQAELLYDLTDEKLGEMQEAISSYLSTRKKSRKTKGDVVDLKDILKSVSG